MDNNDCFDADIQRFAKKLIRKLSILVTIAAILSAIGTGLALAYLSGCQKAHADEEVTYCIDLQTQEVKVVAKGLPCPFPTTQL